jgi:hypothetical protein
MKRFSPKGRLAVLLLLACPLFSFAQGVRIGDTQSITSVLAANGDNFVLAVSGATVQICSAPANAVPCTNKATTYTDSTLTVACATSTQVTLQGTNTCVANPDTRGNWGAWVASGQYEFTVSTSTGNYGPFAVTASVTNGGSATLTSITTNAGTSSVPLVNQNTGGPWTCNRWDNTNQYGPAKSPFSNAYIGSCVWVESHAGSNNADQFFGLSSFMMVGTTPANSSSNHSDSKVAGYFAARRDPGSLTSSGVTAINSNVDVVEDSTHGDFSIEADFNNGTGTDYSISTTTASKDGVVVASGGSNRPRWGFRTASTNDSTNAWDGGAFIAGWYTKGLVVKPANGATGTIGIDVQAKGPAATSIATEQQSPYISFTANRWNDSTLQSFFDVWKVRAETIPHSAGTAGTPALYWYDWNGNKLVRYVANSGSSEILQIGGSSAIVNGQFAVTSYSTYPGIRITPLADDTNFGLSVTNAANSQNNFFVRHDGSAGFANSAAAISSTGKGTFNGGVQAGASGSTISDTRELVQNAHSCGTTTTCANTANGSNRIVFGNVALSSGTPSTAVVTGITAFTSTSSYVCTATNKTTAADPVKVVNTSTSSITITGPNTVTDSIDYICIGN